MMIIRRLPTSRQREALDFIKGYQARNGISPSLAEIAEALNIGTIQGAHSMVNAMVRRGLITKNYHEGRSIQIVPEGEAA